MFFLMGPSMRSRDSSFLLRCAGALWLALPVAVFSADAEPKHAPDVVEEPPAPAQPLPRVKLSTARGEVEIELYEDDAPNTVANFIEVLVREYCTRHGVTENESAVGFTAFRPG